MTSRKLGILTVAILLAGAGVCGVLLIGFGNRTVGPPTTIVVQAHYPGAKATTIADTVAAPIEQQLAGVEHLESMSSQSASDGSYLLRLQFETRIDLDTAQNLVRNRVSLAAAMLPDLVQAEGISVRKKLPQSLLLVSLTSPSQKYDDFYLSNYATMQIKDELARLRGVGDVVLFGERNVRMRVALDADKLATNQLSSADVIEALRLQGFQVAGPTADEAKAEQSILVWRKTGGPLEAGQLGTVVVKANVVDGRSVRLTDVVRFEAASSVLSSASIQGQPAVLLGLQLISNVRPSAMRRAVHDKLTQLSADVPDGISLTVALDLTLALDQPNSPATPEHLVIDVELPTGASEDREIEVLNRAAQVVEDTPDVQAVMTLTRHPFSLFRNQPCLIVVLDPKRQRELSRERMADKLRAALQERISEMMIQVSVPSASRGFPIYGFPIELAVEDHGNHGSDILWQHANALVAKMNQSGKFVDASVGRGLRPAPALRIDIDREACNSRGVAAADVMALLKVHAQNPDLPKLQVKDNQNELVRIEDVVRFSHIVEPAVIERHNMFPSVRITANLADGVSLRDAKSLCETLAAEEFDERSFVLRSSR